VVLSNGSRIVCTVVRMDEGKLIVQTDFAGELSVDATKVRGITTNEPVNVQLNSGQHVLGTLRFAPDTGQQVAGKASGTRAIKAGELHAMWGAEEDSPAVVAEKKKLEAARPKWSLEAGAGIDGQTGNSERTAFNGSLEVHRKTDKDRLLLYGLARYGKEEGVESAKEFIGGANYERDLTDRCFAWGKLEFEYDKFESLDLRTTGTAGLGCFVIREEDHELKLRGGGGFQHEAFTDGTTQCDGVAELGVDYRKDFSKWLSFVHQTTYFPTLADAADFRLVMSNKLEVPLNSSKTWKIRAGIRNQYDNMPEPGIKHLDTFYFLNLVAELK